MKDYGRDIERFIEDNIDLIDANRFNLLYKKASAQLGRLAVFLVTEMLLDADIDPLETLNYVPEHYLRGSELTHVTIPDTIFEVGENAFSNSSLKDIHFPDSVEKIGISACSNCSHLEHVTIDGPVRFLRTGVFSGCSQLKMIELPNTLEEFHDSCFEGVTGLTVVYNGTKEQWSMIHSKSMCGWKNTVVECIDGTIKQDELGWNYA